jgi:hypothetical protein
LILAGIRPVHHSFLEKSPLCNEARWLFVVSLSDESVKVTICAMPRDLKSHADESDAGLCAARP